MAPLMASSDFSLSSCEEDFFVNQKTGILTPLDFPESADQPSSPKKRVSFGASVTEHEVMSRHEYTYEEMEESFHNDDEMRRLKEAVRVDGRLLNARKLCPDTNSPRGLEHRTRAGYLRRRRNRDGGLTAVFWGKHLGDDSIAELYAAKSQSCLVAANAMGRRDEREAMRIHREEA